ncbi:YlzJ-like family protein [Thalassobacillus sp. CUG 92003]|uniref:YlzJ-like family protein n=1 Tax=Thalassobacillus sp. CUG 92003 TaxID=2736641 RepID=UPI0015E69E20|nr:YlzJ-like family protein [Thalassobacillus sp. CUG 92003]
MILYTPLSEHDIFPARDEDYQNVLYGSLRNCPVKVMDSGDGHVEVVQLLSTDPQDFLDDQLQPGRKIKR